MSDYIPILSNYPIENENPLFLLRGTEFGVFCENMESICTYWDDNIGSVGKYYSLLGLDTISAKGKDTELNNLLITLNENAISKIRNPLRELLKIFKSGLYQCNYYKSNNNEVEVKFKSRNIVFPKYDVRLTTYSEVQSDYSKLFNKGLKEYNDNYIPLSFLHTCSTSFYDGSEDMVMATKHSSVLDLSRISFYEEKIIKGENPIIIVYRGIGVDECRDIHSFIVDGHHKAKAYRNLNVNPAVIEIVGMCDSKSDYLADLRLASKILYPDQMIDLISRNYAHDEKMNQICQDEYLSKYCLNGYHKSFYPNGIIIKSKGFYANSKLEGEYKKYYPNGNLEYHRLYKDGYLTSTLERFNSDCQQIGKTN